MSNDGGNSIIGSDHGRGVRHNDHPRVSGKDNHKVEYGQIQQANIAHIVELLALQSQQQTQTFEVILGSVVCLRHLSCAMANSPFDDVTIAHQCLQQLFLLLDNPCDDICYEVVWCLGNILYIHSAYIPLLLVDAGAINQLIKLLSRNNNDLYDKVLWLLSGIARASPQYCDIILSKNPLAMVPVSSDMPNALLITISWVLLNLCTHNSDAQPRFNLLCTLLPTLNNVIEVDTENTIAHTLSCLSYLVERARDDDVSDDPSPSDKIEMLINSHCLRVLIKVIDCVDGGHNQVLALSLVSDILASAIGNPKQNVVNCNILPAIVDMLDNHSDNLEIYNVAIRAVFDIAYTGTIANMTDLMLAEIFHILAEQVHSLDFLPSAASAIIQPGILAVIYKAVCTKDSQILQHLEEVGWIDELLVFLDVNTYPDEEDLQLMTIDIIEQFVVFGEEQQQQQQQQVNDMNDNEEPTDDDDAPVNIYAETIEQIDGSIDILQELATGGNAVSTIVSHRASALLEYLSKFINISPTKTKERTLDIPKLIEQFNDTNPEVVLEAVTHLRKEICIPTSELLKIVVENDMVSRLIALLHTYQHTNAKICFEVAWCLTNIASDDSYYTKVVVDAGAVEPLIALLDHEDLTIVDQSVWAIGNIAGDNTQYRDLVLAQGVLPKVLQSIERTPEEESTFLLNQVWMLCNLCRGKNPPPNFNTVSPMLPTLCKFLKSYGDDIEILKEVTWALSHISDTRQDDHEEENVESERASYTLHALQDHDALKPLIELVHHEREDIQLATLTVIGNIVSGTSEFDVQMLLNHDIVPHLTHALLFTKVGKNARREILLTLSNIATGPIQHIDELIHAGVFQILLHSVLPTATSREKQEMTWVIANAIGTRHPQVFHKLMQEDCHYSLTLLLTEGDYDSQSRILLTISEFFAWGESHKIRRTLIHGEIIEINEYVSLFKTAGLEYKLHELLSQHHPERAIIQDLLDMIDSLPFDISLQGIINESAKVGN